MARRGSESRKGGGGPGEGAPDGREDRGGPAGVRQWLRGVRPGHRVLVARIDALAAEEIEELDDRRLRSWLARARRLPGGGDRQRQRPGKEEP